MEKSEALLTRHSGITNSPELIIPTILIFKTNIIEIDQGQFLAKILQNHFSCAEISFDLGDCDKVLRIKHQGIFAASIIHILNQHGFDCAELID